MRGNINSLNVHTAFSPVDVANRCFARLKGYSFERIFQPCPLCSTLTGGIDA
jgi:hypothetical protein